MRKLILEVQLSIDGFIAGSDGNTDWMIWNWSPEWKWDKELQKYHTDLTKTADCIFLSRQMAEAGFIDHWAKASEIPDDPQFDFAKHITDTYKVVFTKTLDKSTSIPGGWNNTDIAEGDYVKFIEKLKKQNGKNIIVYCGAAFVSFLIQEKLIDEFHLLINPVIIGSGLSIFSKIGNRQDMTLVKSKSFDCGIILIHYIPNNN